MTKKDQAKEIISEQIGNYSLTIKAIKNLSKNTESMSIDTIRKAVKELIIEEVLEIVEEEGKFLYRTFVQETISPSKSTSNAKSLEVGIVRTDFTKGWKTDTIVKVLNANIGQSVLRSELAAIVGSDCKNIQIFICTLRKGSAKYPPMNIEYNRSDRSFVFITE